MTASTKKWYQSKLVWLGVITTLLGVLPLVQQLVSQASIQPADFVALFSGILTVILRVWFTNTEIS